jgi:hypothetical protein
MLRSVGCNYSLVGHSERRLGSGLGLAFKLGVECIYIIVNREPNNTYPKPNPRKLFMEKDADINHALERVQEAGMVPILCIGEREIDR